MRRVGRRRGLALLFAVATLGAACWWAVPVEAKAATLTAQLANVRVGGGEDAWRADGEFPVFWDLAPVAGGTEPPTAVTYVIEDPNGNPIAVRQAAAEAGGFVATLRTGPHSETPAPGVYRLSLWLEPITATTRTETLTLRFDNEPPPSAQPRAPEGWIKAGAGVTVEIEHPGWPRPLSGIRGYAVELDHGSGAEPCAHPVCAADEIDLDGGEDEDSIVLGPLAEGTNVARVAAVSGAGLASAVAGTAVLHVDGTPPAIALGGVPSGWSNQPLKVTATATDPLSGTAANGPSGPITAIAVDGGAATVARGSRATLTVHGDGAHLLTAFARDAVGNAGAADPDAARSTAWIDETAPSVAFASAPDPARPEQVVAFVGDLLSGPSTGRGSIAIRPAGSSLPFEALPTQVSGDRLIANWASDAFPRGAYEFRAVAFDAAGNRAETNRRADGSAMVLVNPVKAPVMLAFGFGGRRFVAHRCRRTANGLRCRNRTIAAFSRRPAATRVGYRRRVPVGGRLTDGGGAPLAGLPVEITETFGGAAEPSRRTRTVTTGAGGVFLARLDPGPSRRLTVAFTGTGTLAAAASRSLRLGVRSSLRLRASSASAAVGGAPVLFSGHLGRRGTALPTGGIPVALEFRVAGQPWSEFRTVQTDGYGAFRLAYAFADDDSRGVRFQFRAHVAAQPGWPYDPAYSRPITITGR